MANFERYSSPSRGGSLSEPRFESWVVAHSKNCGEQKLLKNRLREIDRERARSLYLLSMERRCVKKDHKKLLMDQRTLVNRSHFHESGRSKMNNPAMSAKSEDDLIQERVNSWKIEMARRCQSASPRILTTSSTDITDHSTSNQPMTSSENTSPKRPSSCTISRNMELVTTDCFVNRNRNVNISDADGTRAISSRKDHHGKGTNSESMSPRRRARRAEIDRVVQSKVSRLRNLSRVPADFNLRAKTSSVSKSGKPQISLNYFQEHHLNEKSHCEAKGRSIRHKER